MRSFSLTLVLASSLVGCGFVRDVVRDPDGAADDLYGAVLGPTLPYLLDGALTVLVTAAVVVSDEATLADHPGWVCIFSCQDRDGDGRADGGIARLNCVHCGQEATLRFAAGTTTLVIPEDGWYVDELGDQGPVAVSFDEVGASSWTWTNGVDTYEQPLDVAEAMDVALFELGGGDGEVDAIRLAVGETLDVELLAVDAEGRILAGAFDELALGDGSLFAAERVGFVSVEGGAVGTVARLTGVTAGETTVTARVGGAERTVVLTVR